MTIRIYPSRLPGEPLETHAHVETTIHGWMTRNVTEYRNDMDHPVVVEIDGMPVPPAEWPLTVIQPDTDVRMYPVPYGLEAATLAWIAVGVAVASAAYSLYMMSQMDTGSYSSDTGTGLGLNSANANTAKLGDPIREVFGRRKIYPDYLVQPVSRFVDKTNFTTSLFLSLGVGNFSFTEGDIKVGGTPVSSLGSDFSYTLYPPGADVSGDERSENWYNSTEVGGTSSGSGLDMGSTSPDEDSITADAVTVSGTSVSFTGVQEGDDDTTELPATWAEGTVLTLIVPDSFTVTTAGLYSVISGNSLAELNPAVGMAVTLGYNGAEYALFIASYAPAVDAVPGVGGSAASITASAAPTTYDFTADPQTFSITWQGEAHTVTLGTNYVTMSGLLDSITSQLTGSGLVARDDSGRLAIVESSSPYAGGTISYSNLPAAVFGDAPDNIVGVASSGGTAAVKASVTLAYGSATGTAFSGLPAGTVRLAIGLAGNEYKITEIDALTITVTRLKDGAVDEDWPGFSGRTVLDFDASGINDDEKWLGPFLACPENETTDVFEVDFSFPNGICGYASNGSKRTRHVEWEVQWRIYGSSSGWQSRYAVYAESTPDGIGFTERFTLDTTGLVEVRCRRRNEQGSNNARDNMYWKALRSRLAARPSSYADITTMAISFVNGSKIAAQSDRRVNVVATRQYDSGTDRTISGAVYHILKSLGFRDSQIDSATIDSLEANYWTPRGEYFDYVAAEDDTSALDILKMIANAGMGSFLLSDGLCSLGREGVKSWTGIISPQETTEPLQTAFQVPSQDDYDAVDVTYINSVTWAEEVVQCRIGANTPSKIEDYTLDGVMDADRAYRIGMRRLMKYLYQRLTHSTTTELDALCYQYMDRIVFTNDIPGTYTTSCLIVNMQNDGETITLSVNEPLDWNIENPRCLIRFQDGSASALLTPARVDDYTLSMPYDAALGVEQWDMDDPYIEPPRLIFCSSTRVGYDGMLSAIEPNGDGTCGVTAPQYDPIFYQYDDATYPGATQ